MKKIYLMFCIMLIVVGCEKDEILPLTDQQMSHSDKLEKNPIENLPNSVSKYLNSFKTLEGKASTIFGDVKTGVPAKKLLQMRGR